MKYIIAFVFLGLVTYAGVFLLFAGIQQNAGNNSLPVSLASVPCQQYVVGMSVNSNVDRQFGKVFTTSTRRRIFDVAYGDPITQHYYVIPAGKIFSPPEQDYMLICVTDEEDVKAMDELRSENLSAAGSGTPLAVSGVLGDMDPPFVEKMSNYFIFHAQLIKDEALVDLVGDPALTMPTYTNGFNHISPYVFYVQRNGGKDFLLIIIGAVVTLVGAGGIVLLALKKHRESTGY
ncbi:MAG: hypothetical protein HDT43_01050 [Ruminococcaceae bacterium]|nr:hypothetical protein [Oscillospiraceae bacterium]